MVAVRVGGTNCVKVMVGVQVTVGVDVWDAVGGMNTVVACVGVKVTGARVLVAVTVGVKVGLVNSRPTCKTTNPKQ